MEKGKKIQVKHTAITVIIDDETDYISLTDMAAGFNEGSGLIGKWITNKITLENFGIWKKTNNQNFNYPEFGVIENEAGISRFIMSVGQWIQRTNASGILVRQGRYGETYTHRDISFHFAVWLSTEFQRLKEDESNRYKVEWNLQCILARANFRIHTHAMRENSIPPTLPKEKVYYMYTDEADLHNMAMFGLTAKQWSDSIPHAQQNIRDEGTIEKLVVLSNLVSINAVLSYQQLSQSYRLAQINKIATTQF